MIKFITHTLPDHIRIEKRIWQLRSAQILQSFLLLLLSLSLVSTGLAQDNSNGVEQKSNGGMLEPLKIAYITQRLNFSTEEAQRFWPIYNQYAQEMRDARIAGRNRPDIEMDEILLNIRKKYNGQFVNVLPPDKVNLFFRSEKEFNGIVRRELQHRAQMRNQQQRHPFRP